MSTSAPFPAVCPELEALAEVVAAEVAPRYAAIDRLVEANCKKVLEAFVAERVSEACLADSTGYGLGDPGRETLDRVAARVFGAEAALVRPHFVSGTHALAAALFGCLRPGDRLVAVTGPPYDTLARLIHAPGEGSLFDFGVDYVELEPDAAGRVDPEALAAAAAGPSGGGQPAGRRRNGSSGRVYLLQRSSGYTWREPYDLGRLARLAADIRRVDPAGIVLVDNCYGEFVEAAEPTAAGADLIAGSLIKNPGGGLAPTGGYVAGRADLVALAAGRLTAPGLGASLGSWAGGMRLLYQGLFIAPAVVGEALKGAVFAARLAERLGFATRPAWDAPRTDIVQAIRFGRRDAVVRFCQGVQAASPVNAFVRPEPGPLPGYRGDVLMAAGTFVQGASLELSADAPMRPPWVAYLQGGLAAPYARAGALAGFQALVDAGLLDPAAVGAAARA